jgi:hypothetical protein
MASIHPKVDMAMVVPDGDGGDVLRITKRGTADAEGLCFDLPLDFARAARLLKQLARVVDRHASQKLNPHENPFSDDVVAWWNK